MSYVISRQAEEIAIEKRNLWPVQGYGVDAQQVSNWAQTPWVRAVFMGVAAYSIARLVKAQPKVAQRIGLVTGGMELLIAAGRGWLEKELAESGKPAGV